MLREVLHQPSIDGSPELDNARYEVINMHPAPGSKLVAAIELYFFIISIEPEEKPVLHLTSSGLYTPGLGR